MQLHQLQIKRGKDRKRVGRGGKRGTTSGRGQKGQKSRSGRRIRPAVRDLILRLPKRRGFRNKPKNSKPAVFNLSDLSLALKVSRGAKGPVLLDRDFLTQAGLLKPNYNGSVKILGDGEIGVPVEVKGLPVSKSAKEKIEKAGGHINADLRGPNADKRGNGQRKSA
jgi:large subunit ribosomal protein L15